MKNSIVVPSEWEQLNRGQATGTWIIIGSSDVGKTTFAQYLFPQLNAEDPKIAYLDGDPGQSTLGAPTTITVALSASRKEPSLPWV